MKDFKVYLFDFDGTIMNTYPSLIGVYDDAFKEIGERCSAEQASIYMHESLLETCERRHVEGKRRELFYEAIARSLNSEKNIQDIVIFPDTIPTLEALEKKGKGIGLVSGNTEDHIHLVLKTLGLDKYFKTVVGFRPGLKGKPAGDSVLAAISSFPNVKPSEAIYVGDSLQDPLSAINAGSFGVLLERNKEYSSYTGEKIESLLELIPLLRSNKV